MIGTAPAAAPAAADQPPALAHAHAWRLQAVWHEDGAATEEFGCAGCGGVTFR